MSDDIASQLTKHEREVLGLSTTRRALIEGIQLEAARRGGEEALAIGQSMERQFGKDIAHVDHGRALASEEARMTDLYRNSGLSKIRKYISPPPTLGVPGFRRIPDLTRPIFSPAFAVELSDATAFIGGPAEGSSARCGVESVFLLPYSTLWLDSHVPPSYKIYPRIYMAGYIFGSAAGGFFYETHKASCKLEIRVEVFQIHPIAQASISLSGQVERLFDLNWEGSSSATWLDYEYGYMVWVPSFVVPVPQTNVLCRIGVTFDIYRQGNAFVRFGSYNNQSSEYEGRPEVLIDDFGIYTRA